jgi:HlyD family secretion protein
MKPALRRLAWLAAALAVVALLALLFRPRPEPVETAVVTRGPLRVTIDEEGETRIEPRYVIAAPVSGRLAAIDLDAGDPVALGAPVARIYPSPLDPRAREQAEAALRGARASKAEADAQVAEAGVAWAKARQTLGRMEEVAAAGGIAPEELDRLRSEAEMRGKAVEAARFRAEAARCQVEGARAALLASGEAAAGGDVRGVDVCSPAAGRVLRVFEESERVVPAGTPLLEVGDPANLEVVVDVLSTDAVAIRAGAPMLLDAGGGHLLEGRVKRVEPAAFAKVSPLGVEEQRVNVIGELSMDTGAPRLGDRYRVAAQIVQWQAEDVLKVPAGALFRARAGRPESWVVFALVAGRARLQPVVLGHRNPTEAEVLGGLAEGDRVILYPGDRLEDGTRVRSARTTSSR